MPNDLVIKLLGEDATSPAIRSATAGVTSYGNAVRSTMARVSNETARARNSWMSFVDLTETSRMPSTIGRLNDDTLGVAGMDRRQRAIEHAASMYEKSTGRMARALQKLNQDEVESAAKSEMIIQRSITQQEQISRRATRFGNRPSAMGGVSGNRQMMIQQGVFMVDDAIAGGTNGGVRGALLGASNNATMLAMMLGGVGTQLAVIGGIAAVQIGVRMYESLRKAHDGAKLVRDGLEKITEAANKVSINPMRFRYIDEEVEGQSSKRLQRMRKDAEETVKSMSINAQFLQEEYKKASSVVVLLDTPDSALAKSFNSNEERMAARKQAASAAAQIGEKMQQAREEQRQAIDFLNFTQKNRSVEEAIKREEAEAAEKRLQDQERADRAEQQRARKIERGNRELEKLNKEREKFAMGIYGDQGQEEGVLSQMGLRLTKARELFSDRPQQLAEAERQITSITEEQLARLKVGGGSQATRNPSLALVDSDRARQITLGAGNQARDATTRHNSVMERLTAQMAADIREQVREAQKDIELVIDVAQD